MRGEIEHLVLALAAEIEVEVGNDDFVRQRLRLGDDPAVRIHDAGTTDQSGTILIPRLGDRDRPCGVHIGVGLGHKPGMEGAQRRVFGDTAVRIVSGGIIADANQFDALQAQHTPAFWPAAIIADHHAHDRMAPVRPRPERGKSEIAIFEVALFELLVDCIRTRLDRAGQMHLPIAPQYLAVAIDQHRTVEALTVRCQFGITDIEAHTERPGAIEQGLHGRIWHATLEVMIERFAFDQPSREESRERQFGENHQ